MSLLEIYKRPLAVFDPDNPEHRRMFAEFCRNKSWRDCPVRFVLVDDQGYTYNAIQNRLVQWYLEKEFESQ